MAALGSQALLFGRSLVGCVSPLVVFRDYQLNSVSFGMGG